MLNWIRAIIFSLTGLFFQLFFILSGLLIAALPKRKDVSQSKPFTEYEGDWFPVHLPAAFHLWDNREDGARGDHRGWYWQAYYASWPDWFKYYFWLAIRNPANNFKRFTLGADIRTLSIKTVYGQDYVRDDFDSTGWQLVKGTGAGLTRWHVYWVKRYGSGNHALVVELGNKIQVRHNGTHYDDEVDYWKGFTFEINPYKDIS